MSASSSSQTSRFLAGRHIVITRPESVSDGSEPALHPLRAKLEAWGAMVSYIPMVSIEAAPFELPRPNRNGFDWLFFTSKNAVRIFFESSEWRSGAFGIPLIAAVGPATAQAIEQYGQSVAFVATRYDAEHAAVEFAEQFFQPGLSLLWPCGNLANQNLRTLLSERHVQVTPLVVYRTTLRTALSAAEEAILRQPVDMLVFTSPSAVSALKQLNETAVLNLQSAIIACLGPKTTQAAVKLWGHAEIQAEPYTFDALAQAILDFYLELNGKVAE